jgi:putative ABC transport system permease protein
MGTILADLRQALRALWLNPGFSVAAIGILALGIAANTAVFSVADAVLFRPLAYDRPEQLVTIAEVIPQYAKLYPRVPVNAKHYYEWRARCRPFADLAILERWGMNLTADDGPPERLGLASVSANLFPILGVRPQLGRNFTAEEDRPKNDRVVLISDRLWRRRFHGDPAILSKSITLNGIPHMVAGILPAALRFPRPDLLTPIGGSGIAADLFKPIAFDQSKLESNGSFNYTVIGRLRAGVTREQAQVELNSVQAALTKEYSSQAIELRSEVTALQEQMVAGSRRGLLVLRAAIGAVLLIMCVNLGNLMLARATARGREMAVRMALGARPWRVVRQVLTESVAISFCGGALGLALAYATVRMLALTAPIDLPRLDEVRVDYRAELFAFAASLAVGILFGLAPALRAARSEPQDALRSGGRTATLGRGGVRLSELLITVEVALSATLLAAAGLLVASFVRILGADQGYRADNALTAKVNLSGPKYREGKQRTAFFDRLLPAVQNLPGVEAAGMISALPLQGETWVDMITRDDDHRPMFQRPVANYRMISPDYYRAMGMPIRRGRAFEPTNRNREVVIVSESAAARIWPGEDAVGKHCRASDDKDALAEVIGVTADTRTSMIGAPPLIVYMPYWKKPQGGSALTVRTTGDPVVAAAAVRGAIWSIDSGLPIPEMKTMRQVLYESVSQRRFQTLLLAGFAISALLLAAIGIYGVISNSVNRRRNEIGIRMALGADASRVRAMVLRQGMRPVALGLIAGIAGALALGRLLEALLFEMRPNDPRVLVAVAIVLAVSAALACYAPARRATQVDPAIALRYD